MRTSMDENWSVPRYSAELWWCGDEVCDCSQPQIDLITPNLTVGPPWIRRTNIWRGTFKSGGETEGLREELEEACRRFGIKVGTTIAWDQPKTVAEDVDAIEMNPDAGMLFRGGPLDGQFMAIPEPLPPTFYAPIPPKHRYFEAEALTAKAGALEKAVYEMSLRPPKVYRLVES